MNDAIELPELPGKPKIKVMVSTPVRRWGGINAMPDQYKKTCGELAKLTADPACPYEFELAFIDGGIVRARNRVVTAFLKTDCKWLVSWDDDIEATGADFIRLLAHKQPVVAGMYTRRDKKSVWVANFLHEVTVQKGGILQVVEIGLGLKCFHREVFTELIRLFGASLIYTDRDSGERCHAFFQQAVVDGDLLTEDYFMDYLCRRVKIGLWADTNTKLRHRGPDGTLYPLDDKWPPIPGVDA